MPLDGLKKVPKISASSPSRIDFLLESANQRQSEDLKKFSRPKLSNKHLLLKIFLLLSMIFLISGAMYLSEVIFSPNSSFSSLNRFNPFKQLVYLVTSTDKKLAGENKDRVNFLLLGVGGAGHEGPFLTDTIMVASLKPSTKEVALLSLPRDMIIPIKKDGWQKINQIYSTGKAQENDQGAEMITRAVSYLLDMPIHYYAIINFKGFEEFINQLGGLNVKVEKGFVDNEYPTDDFLTTTVSFAAGEQIMDGPTALIFVRSRHGNNGEGSDFARSKRQQLVLQALRDKILTTAALINPKTIGGILELLQNHLETNISIWQALKLGNLAKEISDDNLYQLALDDGPDNLLVSKITPENGYLLLPKDNTYENLRQLFKNIFNTSKIKEEGAKIAIQNGTSINGLAYNAALYLEKLNYQIISRGNAAAQNHQQTLIYDLTRGQKKNTLAGLAETLQADIISDELPADLIKTGTSTSLDSEQPDIVIILGFDRQERFKMPEETSATSTPETTATSTID